MDDSGTDTDKVTAKVRSAHDPFEELSKFLKWSAARATPLAFWGIAIATMLWLGFIKRYGLPVSFLSSGLLSGLPALFAVVTIIVVAMMGTALTPALALWTRVAEGGQSLATLIWTNPDAGKGADIDSAVPCAGPASAREGHVTTLLRRWLTLNLAFALYWMGWFFLVSHYEDAPTWPIAVLGLFAPAMVALLIFRSLIRAAAGGRSWSFEFIWLFSIGAFWQSAIAFLVMAILVKTGKDAQGWQRAIYIVAYPVAVGVIGLAQLVAARLAGDSEPGKTLRKALLVVMALVTCIAPIPSLGGVLAAYPLAQVVDGCRVVVLNPPPPGAATEASGTADHGASRLSNAWVFVSHIDDTYYLKTDPLAGTVYLIPASRVASVEACNKDTVAQATKEDHQGAAPLLVVAGNETSPIGPSSAGVLPQNAQQGVEAPRASNPPWVGHLIAGLTGLVALAAWTFSVVSWRETYRPVVTARINTKESGNQGYALEVVVENAGTRPAHDVWLEAMETDVRKAMKNGATSGVDLPLDAKRVFFSKVVIPVLPNGNMATNAFGTLGQHGDWVPGATIAVTLHYQGSRGRRFRETTYFLLHDNTGFAQTSWGKPYSKNVLRPNARV